MNFVSMEDIALNVFLLYMYKASWKKKIRSAKAMHIELFFKGRNMLEKKNQAIKVVYVYVNNRVSLLPSTDFFIQLTMAVHESLWEDYGGY